MTLHNDSDVQRMVFCLNISLSEITHLLMSEVTPLSHISHPVTSLSIYVSASSEIGTA